MRNNKLLFILIPVIIVVLVLSAGIVFFALNSSPEKIFANSINKIFEAFESSEEKNSTMKGTMNLTASVESDNEQMQAINTMLEGTNVGIDMQADIANMLINENLNVTVNNENLLNGSILLQNQKGYLYLPDWIDKYLQIPEEELTYSDFENAATLDQNVLMEAIKEELIVSISNQELVQEKTTLLLEGQETNTTASTLSLKDVQITDYYKELFRNLNKNEKFLLALGAYKEDVQTAIDEMILDVEEAEGIEFVFTIYTKGFLNEFVGISCKIIDSYGLKGTGASDYFIENITGVEFFKHNDEKYEVIVYEEYNEKREEVLKLIIEDRKTSKNKGTTTITMTVEEQQFVVTYNYEKQGNQTSFVASTEIEGVAASISGEAIEDGKNVKGNFMISLKEETFGKVNLNCAYEFTYDVEIQKVDVGNTVSIDKLSEEDKTTLMTNLQNSALYKFIEQSELIENVTSVQSSNNKEPEVSYDGYTVKYTVPENFEISEYSSEDYKIYMDEKFNSVNITIEYDSVDNYMSDLDDDHILTSDFYENQKISDTKSYTVNGKEYKFRTITYNDEYGSYVEIYFVYELDDEYCYVVEVESQGGISMETIKKFLDMTIE